MVIRRWCCAVTMTAVRSMNCAGNSTPIIRAASSPHVTLLYDAKRLSLQEIAPPVSWPVTEVLLIRSLIGVDGMRYWGKYPLC